MDFAIEQIKDLLVSYGEQKPAFSRFGKAKIGINIS
jgi:hypothetical protein